MDGADASLARHGDSSARRAPTDLDSATVVIDPQLPLEVQDALASATGKLVAYSGPVPAPESPRYGAGGCLVIAGIFFFVATLGFVNGATGGGYTMLAVGGIATLFALLARPGARDVAAAHAPVTQHRRYVLPATDIDAAHWQLWKRAVDARNRIVRADVVGAGQIDSVQVAEVLPQRLWEIAERLARLSEVRALHQEILGTVSPDDPDVAPAVSRQRRAQEIAAADVARRVRNLEVFADLVEQADGATRKESILRELHALDDKHAELIAGVGDTAADADLTRRLADDATAVIEQARDAIRRANDAARSLALPADEPADDTAGDITGDPGESLPASLGNRLLAASRPPRLVHLCSLASLAMSESLQTGKAGKPGFTRRRFIIGSVTVSAAAAIGGTVVRAPRALASTPPSGPPTTTIALPTTTEPEQLLLTWGSDPASEVTVSWSAPGTVAQPAPTLAFSARPITAANPGRLIKLPDPKPLDVSERYDDVASVSFTDGLNGQTTYFYHVQLNGLEPGTRYYYQISDGAATPSTAGSSFETAPFGRAKFRFSSFGDLATPSYDLNTSGNIWHESCDNSWYAVTALLNPGDGQGAPLFHLLNGDLCYANLDVDNAPGVWRDFGNNIARSAASIPWMPALGNHECEFGVDTFSGQPGEAPGGIAAQGAAGNHWNGPYGFGHYLSRFLLPDNGLVNWDGNRLRGNFYTFQVGTIQFISLDADDVIYQDGAANYVIDTPDTGPDTTTTGAQIPNGTTNYTRFYTGNLTLDAADNSLVPDYGSGKPNIQTLWLESTLAEARRDPSVDMIVVFMHQVPLSTSSSGNGSDLAIRQAWLPLFDKYEVDLVLHGHEHDYERSYPVRGYDPGEVGTVVAPNPGQTKGEAVATRRPTVVTTEPYEYNDIPAWNTAEGTVYLVLGGGGTNGPTNSYGTDAADDLPQAKVITTRNAVVGSEAAGFVKNGADSVEDAPWSAAINPTDAYGYAIFDVDPGERPGDTTITFQYFAIPAVSNEATSAHNGTTTLPSAPTEKFVFGRRVGHPGI